MFCRQLEGGVEEFKSKLSEFESAKAKGACPFELDAGRISSLTKLREVLAVDGAVKVYPPMDQIKGRIFAGTQLEGGSGTRDVALIQVDVAPTNPPQCFLTVYCAGDDFRNAVAGSILDLVTKGK